MKLPNARFLGNSIRESLQKNNIIGIMATKPKTAERTSLFVSAKRLSFLKYPKTLPFTDVMHS